MWNRRRHRNSNRPRGALSQVAFKGNNEDAWIHQNLMCPYRKRTYIPAFGPANGQDLPQQTGKTEDARAGPVETCHGCDFDRQSLSSKVTQHDATIRTWLEELDSSGICSGRLVSWAAASGASQCCAKRGRLPCFPWRWAMMRSGGTATLEKEQRRWDTMGCAL